jgi:hypothetical protein
VVSGFEPDTRWSDHGRVHRLFGGGIPQDTVWLMLDLWLPPWVSGCSSPSGAEGGMVRRIAQLDSSPFESSPFDTQMLSGPRIANALGLLTNDE